MKIGIIIVTYNSQKDISRLLDSLCNQTINKFFVYIVDNNSTDKTVSIVEEYESKLPICVIHLKTNSGYAGGNNTGIKKATEDGCEFAFILNPDMKLDKKCLELLVERIKQDSNEEIGVFGPTVLFPNKNDNNGKLENYFIQVYGITADFKAQKKVATNSNLNPKWSKDLTIEQYCDFVLGGAMMIRCNILNKTGLFDEDYFMYNDEIDIAYRIKKAGYKTLALRDALVWHYHDFSKENKKGYNLMYYYVLRNKYLYFRKYRLYTNLFLSLMFDIINVPFKIIWSIRRMGNIRLMYFYYCGLLDGILGKKGKSNKSFNSNNTLKDD